MKVESKEFKLHRDTAPLRYSRALAAGVFGLVAFLVEPSYTAAQIDMPADDMAIMEAYQNTLRHVSQEVLPVVVEIDVVERVSRRVRQVPSPLEFFFGRPDQRMNGEPQVREFEQRGIGSGIIVRRDDERVYVLTNHHVAGDADTINITLHDGREFESTLVGSDSNRDLALVVFETGEEVPVARLGDSDVVQVGDFVLAVGNPLGFESTVTSGIVSAVERQSGPQRRGMPILTDYIQTDAAINRGNSGGALVNLYGEVVGINTWIASQSGGNVGLGFAIPINNARRAIDQFIESGSIEYGWLGVNMADTPSSQSNSLSESQGGAFVYNVYSGSPAANAGIEPGDIVVRVGAAEIETSNDLLRAVTELEPGNRVPFQVRRHSGLRTVYVRAGVRPSGGDEVSSADLWPGMSIVEVTDEIRSNLNLSNRDGDLIVGQVTDGSPASVAGLRSGDIITRVNNNSVSTLRDFYMELNGANGGEIVFRIRRSDTSLIIGLVK
ncbi:MAG: Do family serine endopeptidase [Spirochaetales bacterium]|nr:Do family serine endopeptidase [Spirochaetales bacterium]